jgi:molybdenum cofactor cytidylyltransferase
MRARAATLPKAVWSVVLAAGGSQRLGRPKQLLRSRQRPLIEHAYRAVAALTPGRIVIVVGADALRLRLALERRRLRPRIVHNGRWQSGLAGSLRTGLDALPPTVRAALVVLTDQPAVDAAALAELARAWRRRPSRPAAAHYAGRVGVPAILPKPLWRSIKRADGDAGARTVLRGREALSIVELPQAAFDVDTAADAAALAGLPARRR